MATSTTVNPVAVPMTAAEETAYKRRWIALLLLSLSLMLIVIDSTIVNLAIPSIRNTFNASFADTEWVNSIYSLVFGAALITWGKLGDQFGRRNIFVAGTGVFLIGSLGTGLAANIGVMILFRAVQGMGAAMLSPSTLSIISGTFKGKERGVAFGIWGATAGVAAALGPIIGGWLIQYGTGVTTETWRLTFLINLPIGILAILGGLWAIREARVERVRQRIDWLGIVLASLSLGLIVFGAIEGQNYGWLEAKKVFTLGPIVYPQLTAGVTAVTAGTPSFIPFVFAAGILLFVVFVIVEVTQERRGGEPLFEFGMLRYPSFRYGLLTVAIVALGEFGVVLVLSIYFQLAKGLNAFEAGLRFLPFAAVILIAAPLAGRLSSRFGAKWVVTTGMVCEAISLFLISRVLTADADFITLAIPLMLYGAGVGLAIAQLANIVLSDIPPEKTGIGSGANNTIRQIGASLGIAIIGAVLFGNFATAATPLIRESTAFTDFSKRVTANTELSKEARLFGSQFGAFEKSAKDGIIAGLEANEGFSNANPIDSAIANIPPLLKPLLASQGLDFSKPEVVAKLKTELAPDTKLLSADIQKALATGFSEAGRLAALVASVFVGLGALSSLMLPNRRSQPGEDAVVMAH